MNGIFTPDFLKESETTPECVEENDSAKNLSMENMCTPPAVTKKRKNVTVSLIWHNQCLNVSICPFKVKQRSPARSHEEHQ